MERLTRVCEECGEKAIYVKDYYDKEFETSYLKCEEYSDSGYCAAEKLAEYEDLEEQGKLLRLPCAVGDRVYVIDTDERLSNKEIKTYDISNIVIADNETILLKYDSHDGVICELENIITDKPYLDFYRCFLLKEEAEAALKEL